MPASQFFQLPDEHQQQILLASLSEFARYGYDAASTNRIVQQSGISKGVLFKYFRDKESLFLYVCEVYTREYFTALPLDGVDSLWTFIEETTRYKLRFIRQNPLAYQLLIRVLKDAHHPVYARVLATHQDSARRAAEVLKTALHGELRSGVTWAQVIQWVTWVAAGLQEKYLESLPDLVDNGLDESFEPMIAELRAFVDMLKGGIYPPTADS